MRHGPKVVLSAILPFRYCIDNGAMIAQAGVLSYLYNGETKFADTVCSQRYRTDEMEILWPCSYFVLYTRMFPFSLLRRRLDKADINLLVKLKVFLFDCDGVLWRGNKAIPGSADTVNYLKSKGKLVYFCVSPSFPCNC